MKKLIIIILLPYILEAKQVNFDMGYYHQKSTQYFTNTYGEANPDLNKLLSTSQSNLFLSLLVSLDSTDKGLSTGYSYYNDETNFGASIDFNYNFGFMSLRSGVLFRKIDSKQIDSLYEIYDEDCPGLISLFCGGPIFEMSSIQLGFYLDINKSINLNKTFDLVPFLRLNLLFTSIQNNPGWFDFYFDRTLEPNIGYSLGVSLRFKFYQ
jgi:hypothetical protein